MFIEKSLELNKQNQDYINRSAKPFSKKTHKQLYSEDQSQSSQNQNTNLMQMEYRLLINFKKLKLKKFITNILTSRRQIERQNSHKQIYQEIKMFRVFTSWKKMTAKTTSLKVQAQLLRERNQFYFFKNAFQQWANLIRKPKQQNLKIKQKWFQALKMACSSELSLRLKRIQVQNFIIKKRARQLTHFLKQQLSLKEKNMYKAQNYWQRQTKNKTFALMKKITTKESGQRVRYQQYKLAYLFRTKCLLSRVFNELKSK